MRTAIILLVLCAFACFASATSVRKSHSHSHLHSNSTHHTKVLTRDAFAQSCEDISVSDSILSGACRRIDGSWNFHASLNLDTCFSNMNGVFSCGGDYSQSAQDQSFSGTTLTAALQRIDESWVENSVELNNFISNIDGELECDCR